jgi:hypothetical protein
MMTDAELVAALSVTLSVALLLVIWRALADYRADDLRDRLFAIRDEMFLYALDQGIADTAAHENLRLIMNRLIRYAHRASLGRMLLSDFGRRVFKFTPSIPPLYREWIETVAALPDEQAHVMRDFHGKAMLAIVRHLITGSPLLWAGSDLITFHLIVFQSLRNFINRVVNSLKTRLELDALRSA